MSVTAIRFFLQHCVSGTTCDAMCARCMKVMNVCRFLAYVFLVVAQCASTAAVQAADRYHKSAPLLHTYVEITAYGDKRTESIVGQAFAEMERINTLLNTYDPESQISAVNTAAGKCWVPLGPETCSALHEARKYARLSSGAFDFTVGPLVALWGFNRELPGLTGDDPDSERIAQVLRLVGYQGLELQQDANGCSARLKHCGMRIDVGAFSKGFVADRAVAFLRARGVGDALVAAGGTICASGTKPGDTPWQVGVRHPRNDSTFLTMIPLYDQSVSTSGDYETFYYRAGRRRSHIIDPRSGTPVSAMQSVTVIARSGIASDAFATALFVLGPEDGLALIERQKDTEALLVTAQGSVLYSSGWPQKTIIY